MNTKLKNSDVLVGLGNSTKRLICKFGDVICAHKILYIKTKHTLRAASLKFLAEPSCHTQAQDPYRTTICIDAFAKFRDFSSVPSSSKTVSFFMMKHADHLTHHGNTVP